MNVEKIRNLTDAELHHQHRELSDQLFKMKFQLKMGQTESLKKIREMKKDIARVLTVMREKQIAGGNGAGTAKSTVAAGEPKAKAAAAPRKKAAKKRTAVKRSPAKAAKKASPKKAAKKKAATEKK